jgi:hypothetical protein
VAAGRSAIVPERLELTAWEKSCFGPAEAGMARLVRCAKPGKPDLAISRAPPLRPARLKDKDDD